jgi:hypothetical protein
MNVSGVGATPPPQPVPAVAPTGRPVPITPDPQGHQGESGSGHGQRPGQKQPVEVKLPETPPLRMLTVTEMRVMLGQLPVSAGLRSPHGDVRDAYT